MSVGKLLTLVLLAAIGGLVAIQYPELQRYMKIKRM